MQNSIQSKIDKIRGQGNQVDLGGVLHDILGAVTATPTTTADLKAKRDNGELVAGAWYRITDYQCTTTQENTKSAGHVFDILMLAIDGKTLSEEARAIQHEGDTYFADCNLAAWKIWYCIDNDVRRFMWADEENGKGVIYRMIDEWGNDVPYDFKNIQFVRQLAEDGSLAPDGNDVYVYTFNWYDENGDCKDTSIFGNDGSLLNSEGCISGVYGNTLNSYVYTNDQDEWETKSNRVRLNDIVFCSNSEYSDGAYYGCFANTFGKKCYSNTFGNNCQSNAFDSNCSSNKFGNGCSYNAFGNGCSTNTFGNSCSHNKFGNRCSTNTFGNRYQSNTLGSDFLSNSFGNDCSSNTFGNSCSNNTFGNSCQSNTFGNSCKSNTFDNSCQSNTFDNSCSYNTFGSYCSNNTFGNGCYSNTFGDITQNNALQGYVQKCTINDGCQHILIPSGVSATQKQYGVVHNGTSGTLSNKLTIDFEGGKNYPQFAAKKSDGSLEIWHR